MSCFCVFSPFSTLPSQLSLSPKRTSGFSLIELLTVISIIGIITTVVTVNLASARKQARDVRRKTDIATIQSAIELYANARGGKVPYSEAPSLSTAVQPWINDANLLTYLSNLPVDPLNTSPYIYTYQTGAGQFKNSYIVETVLESEPSTNANLPETVAGLTPADAGFYVTGTFYKAGDKTVHYRVSSGQ